MTKRLVLLVTLFSFLSAVPVVQGKSLWESDHPNSDRSDYTDNVAVEAGDILLIEISESAQATSNSEREREKNTEVGGEANADAEGSTFINDFASWIPIFGANIQGASSFESERESDASGSLNTQMSVLVDSVRENGILELKGERKIKIDDEIKDLKFRGLARAQDVNPDNTIPSDRIANAEIFYESELGLRDGEARGILGKTWKFFKNVLYY